MSDFRQFGRRVPAHQSFGQSVRLNAAPIKRRIRIPTPVIIVALGLVFAAGYLSIPVDPEAISQGYTQPGVAVSE